VLGLLKVNVDRLIAALHGRYWDPVHYWIPSDVPLRDLSRDDVLLYLTLAAVAVPFVTAGVLLTLRRLRDAGLPAWPVALFFVPFVNILLFLVLCTLPTKTARANAVDVRVRTLDRLIPDGKWASAAAGLAFTALLSVLLTLLGTVVLETYGWGLFVGIPFMSGVLSALVFGYHEPRSAGSCVAVAVTSVWLASLLLIGLAVEGAVCILMAAPLAMVVAALGGLVGYGLQRHGPRPRSSGAYSVLILALPALLGAETASGPSPVVASVRTSIVVNAPPTVVWRHVVSFTELPLPKELLFRAGIAYPTSARIEGHGVGAVRRCRFSTGDFVEPITRWDEPWLLAFSVTSQPAPMRELSPWGDIHPPHLDGFLLSRRGQFRLRALPGGRTLLEGTTWYENRMWPAAYWQAWSDQLIHQIHRRVLEHVARQAEADLRGLTNFLPDEREKLQRRGIR
jgi:hypothetical protein